MNPDSFSTSVAPQVQNPDNPNETINATTQPIIQEDNAPALNAPVLTQAEVPEGYIYRATGFLEYLKKRIIPVEIVDTYGNSVLLGSFCNGLAFVIYGFYLCKVFRFHNSFLWSGILTCGFIGQGIAGLLEYCKGRTFPYAYYLTYAGFLGCECLIHCFSENNPTPFLFATDTSLAFYYFVWLFISFSINMGATKINILYTLSSIAALLFFLCSGIGYVTTNGGLKRNAAGICLAVSGFLQLFITISQILNNETFKQQVFPVCNYSPYNGIDVIQEQPVQLFQEEERVDTAQ